MRQPPLEFGLSLPNRAVLFGWPTSLLLELAAEAESSGGFQSVWVGDNLLSKPRLDAMVLLSALAARTSAVKLGTVCMASFPLRHPIPLAIQWASLDVLSGGRTILIVCNGGSSRMSPSYAHELEAMGVASNDRVGRLEEGVEILRRLWTEAKVTHEGRFYGFSDVEALPRPAQDHVPIVIAVTPSPASPEVEDRALRRVGRLSDGWQAAILDPVQFSNQWRRIREYADEYGRADAMSHASCHIMVNINDDADTARRDAADFLYRYYGVTGGITLSEEGQAKWLAVGPPSAVAERLAQYVEAGCSTPILRFAGSDQRRQLERCVTEVLPVVRAHVAAPTH
jgi:alkanesulfonate monooxygenase SsuD/methylene tetrahydromethanopterin reductase-like flavin-dependent oxidoreductase (luciferase family)